jgi:hypothetical protein
LDFLGVRSLPYLARRNYYYEFKHLIPWGMMAGMVEGNAASIVVAKTFGGGSMLVAAASATPIGSLLFASVWSVMSVGRPKLRLALIFGTAASLCAATVAFTPRTPIGGVLFVVQMAAAQIFLSGVVTIRASLWKHNYSPAVRGTIAARLQALRMLTSIAVFALASYLFDVDPGWYRFVYPAAAVLGLLAMFILRRVHVRHERTELARMSAETAGMGRADIGDVLSPRHVFGRLLHVIRTDRRYTRYLATQMFLGISVQMVMPVLVIVLAAKLHRYMLTAALVDLIPKALMFASVQSWGRLYDRVGVLRMRVFTGSCASLGLVFGLAATYVLVHDPSPGRHAVLVLALALFTARAIMHGVHQGGGTLAWNLGHLHFAKRNDAEVYMGLHQALTGVRGIVAPFLGVALWHLVGWWVWGVALVLCVSSVVGFHLMARTEPGDHEPV